LVGGLLVFLGPPGCGKGTQARLLSKLEGWKIFAPGEILRREIACQSDLGRCVSNDLKNGQLASGNIVIGMLHRWVDDCGCILDGFPRDLSQAHALNELVESKNFKKKMMVLDFIVPEKILLERLKERRLCSACDASLAPSQARCNFCGSCNGRTYCREDDLHDSVIATRLTVFAEVVEKLRDFYKKQNIYHSIDATLSPDSILSNIRACVKNRNLI
jgi:adenylate kinase